MIQRKRERERERREVEAKMVLSFRRRRPLRRPFLFDLYHVLEGISIHISNDDDKKKRKNEEDVPFYTYEKMRTYVCP